MWAGVDAGKAAHHCVVINEKGDRLLSRRVVNNEPELLQLIDDVCALATEVQWAIDLNCGGAGLVLAALAAQGQHVVYIPGRVVYHAAAGYRGEGKTDAKDAAIIADQARIRRDLRAFAPGGRRHSVVAHADQSSIRPDACSHGHYQPVAGAVG